MGNLWLTVEVAPGSDIVQACSEAVLIAHRTGLVIWFDFNGVKCLARAGDDPSRIAEDWSSKLQQKEQHRIASDQGEPLQSS